MFVFLFMSLKVTTKAGRIVLISIFFITMVFCYRCSWIESFIVFNDGDKSIYVCYELDSSNSSFPIFQNKPEVYNKGTTYDVDWQTHVNVEDKDTSDLKIAIYLPSKCALVFGRLQNDRYKKYNQYFINGRTFNLKYLQIKSDNKTVTITPSTFDSFFKKHNGSIGYTFK